MLTRYTPGRLRLLLAGSAGCALFAYCVWAFELPDLDDVPWRLLTVIPFTVCILRYGTLVRRGAGEAPEDLVLSDRTLLIGAIAWLVLFALSVHAGCGLRSTTLVRATDGATVPSVSGLGRRAAGAGHSQLTARRSHQRVTTRFPRRRSRAGWGAATATLPSSRGGVVLDMTRLDAVELDAESRGPSPPRPASRSASCCGLLEPAGWVLPVVPGTQHVTVGGAIASDIHGKNHGDRRHVRTHVSELGLLTASGEVVTLTPGRRPVRRDARWYGSDRDRSCGRGSGSGGCPARR